MPRVVVRSDAAGRGLLRLLALGVLAAPIIGALTIPAPYADYEALLWLVAALPVLVLGRERGWEGVGIGLGIAVAAIGLSYIGAAALGRAAPPLLPVIGAVLVAMSLGVGWLAEGVSRGRSERSSADELVDELTGLPARAQAELFLDREFAAAKLGRPLVVVYFDFDRFREFNQRHSESAGNGVLKVFATIVRQHTRRMNLSARWGPEEFVAILCGSSQEGALIFTDRVLEMVRAASRTTPLPTVSAGVACYRADMTSPAQLVAAAEDALRRAKRDGRDRIRVHGASPDLELPTRPDRTASRSATADALQLQPEISAIAQGTRIGTGRTAFVFTADGGIRAQLVRRLAEDGFRVTEGIWPSDGILPLDGDYDVVLTDVGGSGPGWSDLVQEIRRRSPATRIIGIPRCDADLVPASVLNVRLDGYCIATADQPVLRPELTELLRERDRLVESMLRERQLSGEVRAKEREGRVALEESEAKYRSVVQRIKEVIFETDREGRLTFLNSAWSTITGGPTEDAMGTEIFAAVDAGDQAAVRNDVAELVDGTRPYVRREIRLQTAGGGVRWVEVRAQAARNPAGETIGVSGLMSDVHERKQAAEALRRSEEYFRSLIENSADVMAVLDADASIRYSSPALERVLGFTPRERLGHSAFELIHPDDVPEAKGTLGRLIETPAEAEFLELRLLHKDGSWRWLELFMRNLIHLPSVGGLVVNGRDVTDRKAAERALRESEELLFRADKMDAIGRLAGGVAHDFNNLLTSIQGSAELLIASLPAETPARSEVIGIREAAGRANSLTRQLLAFSGRQVLQPRIVDLNDILAPMHKMLVRLMGESVQLRMQLTPELPRTQIDPHQIEQVVLNLSVNARDSMPSGGSLGIRVESVTLESAEPAHGEEVPPGRYVVLTVADTGSGIDESAIDQVFDPFFTTRSGAAGPGLGLSTVYGIIKQSGAYIRVESRSAESTGAADDAASGTTFTVLFPAVSEKTAAAPITEPEPKPATSRETIALVEDERAVRELAQRILRNKGYNVIAAENGRHALDVIGRFPDRIDLLVTDVVMPEMNGRDLADRIAVMRPGVKILFMSGYTDEAIVQHGVLTDGTAFLQKPFSPDRLVSAVREVLDSPIRTPLQSRPPPGHPASHQTVP